MIRKALIIAAKDIKLTFRDPGAVIMGYLAPVILLIIFGIIYSGMMGGSEDINIDLLYVDQEQSDKSSQFLDNLTKEKVFTVITNVPGSKDEIPLTEEKAEELILQGEGHLALVYHKTEPIENFPVMKRPVMTLYYDPAAGMEREITSGLIQKIAFTDVGTDLPKDSFDYLLEQMNVRETPVANTIMDYMNKWTGQMEKLQSGENGSGGMGFMTEGLIDLETKEVVREEVKQGNPFMANSIAGLIVMFLLFSVSFAAASLLKERQEGTIKRLLLAPVTTDQIIWGKFLSIAFNSLCQVIIMTICASIFFHVNILGNIVPVIIMSIATVAATTAFGMIISALAGSYEQIQSSITIIVLSMSAIGGSMFPRILMPGWMKDLGLLTINGWAIEGYLDALYRYNGAGYILGYGPASNFVEFIRNSEAIVLILFALLCGWLAARLFKKKLISGN
ncbi:MAG: ABC transporter permease [bacterium]